MGERGLTDFSVDACGAPSGVIYIRSGVLVSRRVRALRTKLSSTRDPRLLGSVDFAVTERKMALMDLDALLRAWARSRMKKERILITLSRVLKSTQSLPAQHVFGGFQQQCNAAPFDAMARQLANCHTGGRTSHCTTKHGKNEPKAN